MDDLESGTINKDDEAARRLATLELMLSNADRPLASSKIKSELWPDSPKDSFTRAFSRDRDTLANMGIYIVKAGGVGEATWEIDAEKTYRGGAVLNPEEARVINVICQPFVAQPGFLYANELRFALAKIDKQFGEGENAVDGAQASVTNISDTLLRCQEQRHLAEIDYTNARDERSTRLVAPFSFYTCRKKAYMVAARAELDENSEKVVELFKKPGTYLLDRVNSATEKPKMSFEIPAEHLDKDWKLLPFQIGKTPVTATFHVDAEKIRDFKPETEDKGTWAEVVDGAEWTVEVRDYTAAASWAIAKGVRPVSPSELVEEWKNLLEGVANRG